MAVPSGAALAAPCLPAAKIPLPDKNVGTRVAQICRDAKSLPSLDGTVLIDPNGTEHAGLLPMRYRLTDGTGFVVPPGTSIELVSGRGNVVGLADEIRAILKHEAGDGESYVIDGSGTATFDVAGHPAFWRVAVAKGFFAATQDGTFSVALDDPKNVTFAVTRGSLALTHEINARIASTGETLEGLRAFALLSPDHLPTVTYPRAPATEREFKDPQDANVQLDADLASAKLGGNADAVDGAEQNLALFYARPTVAVATAGTQPPPSSDTQSPPRNETILYISVGASIAATVIYALVASKTKTVNRVVTPPAKTTTTTTGSSRFGSDLMSGIVRQLAAQREAKKHSFLNDR